MTVVITPSPQQPCWFSFAGFIFNHQFHVGETLVCTGVIVCQILGSASGLLLPAPESLPAGVPLPWGVEEPCRVRGSLGHTLAERGTVRLDGS